MRLSKYMQQNLRSPISNAPLIIERDRLKSVDNESDKFPIINGCPILINEKNSLFKISDFLSGKDTTVTLKRSKLKRLAENIMPTSSINLKAERNYEKIIKMLPSGGKILVLGGSYKGEGMEDFYANKSFDLVSTDVSFGPDADLICDAHDIPFNDSTFDCVIIQAVLEHVIDPARCVHEIHRVLKDNGLVYAETPFMQQVHMGRFDFTRFTHLGHRRLFRSFYEIDSGPVGGPGMALAWSYIYFLRSFAWSSKSSKILVFLGKCTSFFWKYFDYFLIDKPGSYDAAAGYFFMGKKSNDSITDHELIRDFKGL